MRIIKSTFAQYAALVRNTYVLCFILSVIVGAATYYLFPAEAALELDPRAKIVSYLLFIFLFTSIVATCVTLVAITMLTSLGDVTGERTAPDPGRAREPKHGKDTHVFSTVALITVLASLTTMAIHIPRIIGGLNIGGGSNPGDVTERSLGYIDGLVMADTLNAEEARDILDRKNAHMAVFNDIGKSKAERLSAMYSYTRLCVRQMQFREALSMCDKMIELKADIRDPYYARGDIFYDLAVLEAVKSGKVDIDVGGKRCTFDVVKDAHTLLDRANDEYVLGEIYPAMKAGHDGLVDSNAVIYKKHEINKMDNGERRMNLHKKDLVKVLGWMISMNDKDKKKNEGYMRMKRVLLDEAKRNPQEYGLMQD